MPAGRLEVRSTSRPPLELQEATLARRGHADVVIMAAAVADYRPSDVADAKIKKETQGDALDLVS